MGKGARARAQRKAADHAAEQAFEAHMSRPGGLRERPEAEQEAYLAAAQLLIEEPQQAARLATLSDKDIGALALQIAYPETFDATEDDCQGSAAMIRWWAILSGDPNFFGWPRTLIAMRPDEIVNAIRVDRAEGRTGGWAPPALAAALTRDAVQCLPDCPGGDRHVEACPVLQLRRAADDVFFAGDQKRRPTYGR